MADWFGKEVWRLCENEENSRFPNQIEIGTIEKNLNRNGAQYLIIYKNEVIGGADQLWQAMRMLEQVVANGQK